MAQPQSHGRRQTSSARQPGCRDGSRSVEAWPELEIDPQQGSRGELRQQHASFKALPWVLERLNRTFESSLQRLSKPFT
jgi:hypothetical protein